MSESCQHVWATLEDGETVCIGCNENRIECWCGAKGTYDELFEDPEPSCGGSGVVHCYCGGDLCVCHNHGERECFGCPDCEDDDEDDYYED